MIFTEDKPSHEDSVLVMNDDKSIIQGRFYHDEDDYYTEDGELIESAIGHAEIPEITWDYDIKKL